MAGIQLKQQRTRLPINNVEIEDKNTNQSKFRRHGALLPNNIRCITCGTSGSGKTNILLSLLESPNGLRFENVYIYSKSLFQPKYQYLKVMLSNIKGIGLYMFSSNESVISLENVKPNSIFIFDDVVCGKQDNIRSYFCMGRHKNVDCFYLSQSYAHIPKHLIRENANFIILFKQDDMNLKHIFSDYGVSVDMSFERFKELCVKCWSEKYGFLVMDTERSINDGKYRMKFDNFFSFSPTKNEV